MPNATVEANQKYKTQFYKCCICRVRERERERERERKKEDSDDSEILTQVNVNVADAFEPLELVN